MDKGNWIFDSAIKGTTYTLVAYLKNQGKTVGKSEPLIVTAPAANEILRINSFATPPATPTPISSTATPILSGSQNISGTINLNGPVLANTKIVVFERVNGTSQFLVAADNIAPTDNAGWSWNNAVRGTTYELMAVLKQHQASTNTDTDLAYSQRLIVAAPAANEVLTINTNLSIPPPSSNPSVSCNNQLASGQWNITASYNTVANANQYWLEVGTQSGGNDVLNYFGNQANQNPQSTNATVNNNTTYYTRYAYAFCSGCTNTSLFSGFSATISFSCPQGVIPTITPTPAWTGYVCNLGSGCQLTKDPNPPYSFTNAGLLQCQADCKVAPTATPTSAPTLTPTPIPPTNTPTLTPTNTPIPTDTPTPIPPTNSLLTP